MKKIIFLTGTRADFGKLKSLIKITQNSKIFDVHIFATGMHMNSKYGSTVDEIYKSGFKNIYTFINHDKIEYMDRTLAKTIDGFSRYIEEIKPDLIIVHGDRVEALAGAIVGSLNNILVTHIEGGEISGTIDETIRHAVSKMSHIHLVANENAKQLLLQLGEQNKSVFVTGSPDLDLMNPKHLPNLQQTKQYYEIDFDDYAIGIFHPITTEYNQISQYASNFIRALEESSLNYILIYPNNDWGSNEILKEYEILQNKSNFKIFPSIRFEYFLTLLKGAKFIIGNSSAGIKEAPYYGIPTIDIGTRQLNRAKINTVFNCGYKSQEILQTIKRIIELPRSTKIQQKHYFGEGKSDQIFLKLLQSEDFWEIPHQKQFKELNKNE